jgi:hypothetical protein
MKSEKEVLAKFANEIAEGIARRTISALQNISDTLSADDTGLVNAWDEICVQVQQDHSFFWDAYDETTKMLVASIVDTLASHEKLALWFQTEQGRDWLDWDEEGEERDRDEDPPVFEADIVHYITKGYVYYKAGRWSNKRIRAYLGL